MALLYLYMASWSESILVVSGSSGLFLFCSAMAFLPSFNVESIGTESPTRVSAVLVFLSLG